MFCPEDFPLGGKPTVWSNQEQTLETPSVNDKYIKKKLTSSLILLFFLLYVVFTVTIEMVRLVDNV